MAFGIPRFSRPLRARLRLPELNGMHARIIGALALGITGVGVLGLILALLCIRFYEVHAVTQFGVDRLELLKTAVYALAGLGAIGAIAAACWMVFRVHEGEIQRKQEQADHFRGLLEASPEAILTVNVHGVIRHCNPATGRMFGYEPKELIGERIAILIPQQHFLHDLAAQGRGAFMAFGQTRHFLTFPVEVAAAEAPSNGSRTFVVFIRDASGRRYSEETLQHISLGVSSTTGEEFVRTLLQQLSSGLQNDCAFVLESDGRPDTTLCSLMVAEHGRIRSKSNHSLVGTIFHESLVNGFTAVPRAVREQFPHDPILARLEAESFIGTPLSDYQGRVVGLIGVIGRGTLANIESTRQTLQIFAARAAAEIARKQEADMLASETARLHGDFTLMQATAERERQRYEEDIAAEQELLAVTLRSIREGCITTDNDGRIITINPIAEELTGWTQPEAEDRPMSEVVRIVEQRNERPVDPQLIFEAPEKLPARMLLRSREGTTRLIEASAAPIRDRQERKLGTVLVFRDVTERSRAEEERQKAEKLESLGLAAGGIAHDFNNLLTAIIGNLSLAQDGASGVLCKRIEASKKASLRAQDLAQQLLTFAKGGAPIKKTASMRQLVLDTVGFSLSGTNIRSDFDIPENLWPVEIDAGQISQVVGNLAVNAVQAMSNGGTLHVSGENRLFSEGEAPIPLRPGRYVSITVRDEGPGIPEEALKKIFDPYFTTKPKGSGLGLATSYSIVKNHDGLIRVESAPGRGATFTILLAASESEVQTEPVAPETQTRHQGRVLVLDDEEIICELVEYALTPLGYQVDSACDAAATLALYRKAMEKGAPYDVVLMDLTIPGGMGGKEAVKELLAMDPGARAIVSSGYAMDPIMSRHREYGFAGVITKPYDIDDLVRVISSTIAMPPLPA